MAGIVRLEAAGHATHAPALTGYGERAHLTRGDLESMKKETGKNRGQRECWGKRERPTASAARPLLGL